MKLPTLYKRTSTKSIQQWTISVDKGENDAYLINVEHGLVNGAKQYSSVIVDKGKNIGKKNETTAKEQAEAEAKSKWLKQKDKGYNENFDEDILAGKMLLKPMLAQKFGYCEVEYPCYIQPKLDGNRCIAAKNGGVVSLSSSGGKPIKGGNHIAAELNGLLNDDDVVDGELYIHNIPLEDLNSLIKKEQEDSASLKYHIYDCITPGPYSARRQRLLQLFPANYGTIELVETLTVEDEAQAMEHFQSFLNQGYEGAILRHTEDEYRAGYRSRSLLKMKEWQDKEFKIVGVKEGKGKFKGLGIIELVTEEGHKFFATPLGDESRRREYFTNKDNYIGKWGTVEYFEYTNTNEPVPKFAKFKCVREE